MSATAEVPIAIVGVGCRFPGRVGDPDSLWELVAAGRSTVGPVPSGRWDAAALAAVHDPEIAERAGFGCFLDGDIWAWDPRAFSVAPLEQRWVDPQFRVLMEVAWQAVEHAGIPVDRLRGSRTGVYMGTYAPDNLLREACPVQDAPQSAYLFGNFTAGAAGRIAFSMDLRGPAMVVSTHCSSGLVALDTACGALTLGECDTALAGGVLLMVSPETHYYEAPLLLSRSGGCHAFDARADGYVRGEGAGVLVLERLADARRAGDRVLAVIRGSAVNNDGQASRLTAPSTEMQQRLFRSAVAAAHIDPGEVGLVEAHGPGTVVGDPVEYTSINAVYGQHGRGRCALGSIKTNIGHSEPVSGIAGLIKTIECLRRGQIAPNAGFRQWNPSIPRDEESRLFVPASLADWPVDGASRLAAVCSYGVTGTNAHVVVESAPASAKRRPAPHNAGTLIHLVSGATAKALTGNASRLAEWVAARGDSASPLDVAHTLAQRRSHAEHRLVVLARDLGQLATRARAFAAEQSVDGVVSGTPVLPPGHAGPVFVFTGQGSQRPGMCQGLLRSEPVFAAAVDELEPLIRAEAGFSLREVLEYPQRLAGLGRIQPALFGVQVALAAVWRSWGVVPAAVIGQSLGEVAALVVAGGLSTADGVKVISRRSALLDTISGGAMASVMCGAERVQAALDEFGADGVSLGVLTSPGSTVVSGDATQIAGLMDRWAAAGVVARMIDVEVASHSSQVDPILARLHRKLAEVPAAEPRIPFYSTVSRDPRQPGRLDGSYWVRNQRDTVRFHTAVSAALAHGHRLFLECSAHPLAVRPILDTAAHEGIRDVVAVGSLRQGSDDQEAFLTHLATLHTAGHDGIDFAAHYGAGDLVDVPVTDWQRTRHGGGEPAYRLVGARLPGATQHPLLGGHVQEPDRPDQHRWQTPIGPRLLPWLADHSVADVPVLPGTGMVEMMLAAAARVYGSDRVGARDVTIASPLLLDTEPLVTTTLTRHGGSARVEIVSTSADGVTVHAHGTVTALPDKHCPTPLSPAERLPNGFRDSAVDSLHRTFRDCHDVVHGPAFTAIDRIQVHPDEDSAVGHLHTHESAQISAWTMALHPALADQVVQIAVSAWLAHYALVPGPVVVAGFGAVRVYGPTAHTRVVTVRLSEADEVGCTASARLACADGTVVAEIDGLCVANITRPSERFTTRLSHVEWIVSPAPVDRPRAAAGTWTVLTTSDSGWAQELARELDKQTAGCRQLSRQTFLADPGTLSACTGVVVALGVEHPGDDLADAIRAVVSDTATVVRQLARCEPPPRLWVLSRADHAPLATASIRGLLRAVTYEHPELRAGVVEFTDEYEAVVAELLDDRQPVTEVSLLPQRHVAQIRSGAPTAAAVTRALPLIRPGSGYLVTGGLGGLGLLTVEWLARQGATRITVSSRGAPSPEIDSRLRSLRAAGTNIVLVQGDIGDPAVAARAVADGDGCPLRGVFHCAGVVADATIATLDEPLLDRVWRGKAAGAWALHKATEAIELDLFVVYSSVAALIGSPGQAAYAAANAFLDGLVAQRNAMGLPATGINWGPWGRVGRGQHLAERGFLTISPADGIDALERILTGGFRQVAYSPLDIDRWTEPYSAVRSATLLTALLDGTDSESEDTDIRARLLAADSPQQRRTILESFIIDTVRSLLGATTHHIGPHTSMVLLGLDSLGAIQLQQRLRRALHTEMKTGVIWVKPSAAALADWLLDHLGFGSGTPHQSAPTAGDPP
ncbi:putative polyketide synthase [Nocardia brasiliensis NBRC 14402]|uniref:Putative polyketide synthase n=1 Tax=Nocardia brasiliensis TaxID=37326 RepID=A0A060PWR0_NOCBR|nr:type I polyketide synthase [Nocardia brasiliensis]BAO99198.1 putative polyketide synthase [Nocardia brasiliensis]GAJ83837.1 putative polyketide synthase [Nocardia brasiliensis NBRC 14402]SUB54130.1 Phthioceranic/hydroxyphthioceranic acid synthase [Nocardia brasiliensis]